MIPKTIHQIWLGSPLPVELEGYARGWKEHHSDWSYKLWTDRDLFPFANRELFDKAPSLAMKADILRYEILYREGGIYIDADFECHRPIDPLVDLGLPLMLVSEFGVVCNGFMGSVPNSDFLERCIDSVAMRMSTHARSDWLDRPHLVTGPGLVDRIYCDSQLAFSNPSVLLPGDFFFEPRTRVPGLLRAAEAKRFATHRALASWVRPTAANRIRHLKPLTRWRRFRDLSHP